MLLHEHLSCSCTTACRRRPRLPPILRATPRSVLFILFAASLLVLVVPVGTESAAADELPPGGTFVDDDTSVHEGYIEALADEEITSGCGTERYCPRDEVTRGQMAAFIVRALSLPAASADYFTDDRGHLFEADINAMAEAGITNGCGDGTRYCPDDDVTRGQMAKFLRRAAELPATSTDYFNDDGDSVFEEDINAIAAEGVTAGCNPPDNTRYCAEASTTRAQMATFLGRLLDLEPRDVPDRDPSSMSVRDAIRTWFPSNYNDALRVADCESNLNPRAVNRAGGWHGLFQIAERYHRSRFTQVTGQSWSDGIYNAYYNAEYARWLYDNGGGWSQWGCKP